MDEVRLREVPERLVLVDAHRLVVRELPAFIAASFDRHRAVLTAAGAEPAGPPYVAFLDPVTDEVPGRVEACTPVPDAVAHRSDLPLRVEPVHREAYTRLAKREVAYPGILEAYALVETWCRQEGVTPIGAPREVYFADFDRAAEDDLVTDVAQPIA
jgi:hypothetical protein